MTTRYIPKEHDDPLVLANAGKWADEPHEAIKTIMNRKMWHRSWLGSRYLCTLEEEKIRLDSNNKPVNPTEYHNGQIGRGLLGKWGVNHSADPVVTTYLDDSLYVLCVLRSDCSGFRPALPGGMVETDPVSGIPESFGATLERELFEEALKEDEEGVSEAVKAQLKTGEVIYTGIVVDPRNTTNAWIETIAVHAHLATDLAQRCKIRIEGDDHGETRGAFWMKVTDDNLGKMYNPSHAAYVRTAKEVLTIDPYVNTVVYLIVCLILLTLMFTNQTDYV